jgi:hypothetical protein
VLAILLLCLVVGFGLLALGVMVWFVVLGMEEGWGRPTVFTVVLSKKLISQLRTRHSYKETVYAQLHRDV